MWRLLDETVAWATAREQGGARSMTTRVSRFPLADSAADAAAGRLLTLPVAELADAAADPKIVHHKASMAKLFTSEAAWRCADRCVQAFGGRGYLRSNVAERLLRELRVDRIWEGTSEIQRLIVARGLERRGVERSCTGSTFGRHSRLSPPASAPDPTPLLEPRSIAVVGRQRPARLLRRHVLRNLARAGFEGDGLGRQPAPHRGARPALRPCA